MHCEIRNIRPEDDKYICHIIKTVGAEFCAIGDGFGPSDEEVECMSQHYKGADNALYLVAVKDNLLIGEGGIALDENQKTFNLTYQLNNLIDSPYSHLTKIGYICLYQQSF